MQVQTFECQETAAEPIEACEEATRLIDEMELLGQQKLVHKADDDPATATRLPYRKMRADEFFVYKQLCPDTTLVENYADSPMPLRVLQIAAHAKSFDFFKTIDVWHQTNANIKDPVLVGIHEPRQYVTENFILARWAEVLDEWPILVIQAFESWKKKMRAECAKLRRQAQQSLDGLDDCSVEDAMKHGNNFPSAYNFLSD